MRVIVADESTIQLILHPGSQQSIAAITVDNKQLILMVGSESGFSEVEVNEAIEKNITPVSLGSRILRVETAIVSVLSNAQSNFGGDLN